MEEFPKRWFLKNNGSISRIEITGIPRFEERNIIKKNNTFGNEFILYAGVKGTDLGYMCQWLTGCLKTRTAC